MNKFEKAALSAALLGKLSTEQFDALLEIIEATPNQTVCVELLCGMYETPVVFQVPSKSLGHDSRAYPVALSYNKFKNEVTYGYNRVPTKTCWVVKDQELPKFEEITPEMEEYDADTRARKLGLTREQFMLAYRRTTIQGTPDTEKSLEDTCSLSRWQ